MKKFYETPAVEFTGFNAEDVITTSIVSTYEDANAAAAVVKAANNGEIANVDAGVTYGSYQW